MLGIHDLPLFVLSGLLLNVTPGADSLYIVTRGVAQGGRAGVAAALGVTAGCCVHVMAGAVGLSALLAASATAFNVLKLVGAAYLVYLGISLMRSRAPVLRTDGAVNAAPLRVVFAQGFLTNVLNPKVALFFLAFAPQFIETTAPEKALAFLVLGAIFIFTGTAWCLFLAWFAANARRWSSRTHAVAWFTRGVGALFVLLGAKLALTKYA